jgi:hypothetical protein
LQYSTKELRRAASRFETPRKTLEKRSLAVLETRATLDDAGWFRLNAARRLNKRRKMPFDLVVRAMRRATPRRRLD